MSGSSVVTGVVLVNAVERLAEDQYWAEGHAVDLSDDVETCTCGSNECWAVISSTIHQARFHRHAA